MAMLLLLSLSSNAQTFRTIEIAVSYDDAYLQRSNPNLPGRERVDQIMGDVFDIYYRYGIILHVVELKNLGNITFEGSINRLATVTTAWSNPRNHCKERDLVIHFTGNYLGGINGEAQGGTLCNSNYYNYQYQSGGYNNYVGLVEHRDRNYWGEVKTAAHEIGHLLGMGHEGDIEITPGVKNTICNDRTPGANYFMCCCSDGDSPAAGINYLLSNYMIPILNNNVNARPCVNQENYDPDKNCSLIFDILWEGDNEIDNKCKEGTKKYKVTVYNDDTPRTFSDVRIFLDRFTSTSLQGSTFNFPHNNITYVNNGANIHLPTFTLAGGEERSFEMDINFDLIPPPNTYNHPTQKDRLSFLSFLTSPDPLVPLIGNSSTGNATLHVFENTICNTSAVNATALKAKMDLKYNKHLPWPNLTEIPIHIDQELVVNEDLVIEHPFQLKMAPNSKIVVKNGAKLEVKNSSISPCGTDWWDGILVEPGGELQLREAKIFYPKNAVRTLASTTLITRLHVENSTIRHTQDRVLDLANGTEAIIYRNTIEDAKWGLVTADHVKIDMLYENNFSQISQGGMYLYDNPNFIDMADNVISGTGTSIGVYAFRTKVNLNRMEINTPRTAVSLQQSTGSTIFHSKIYSQAIGINVNGCSNIQISENEVGSSFAPPEYGISVFQTFGVNRIFKNDAIRARRQGISAHFSTVQIFENADVQVFANDPMLPSGGIATILCPHAEVIENVVFADNAVHGIEVNGVTGAKIEHNFVHLSPNLTRSAAAIQSRASVSATIDANIIFSGQSAHGIYVNNADANTITCNDVNQAYNGLYIQHNAASQRITTNEFYGSTAYDLLISTTVGRQEHHGNKFFGGKALAELDLDLIDLSRFDVNDSYAYHMPSAPNPEEEWFWNNPNQFDLICGGQQGPGLVMYQNPQALCAYYQLLQQRHKAGQKNPYLIQMAQLLKYYAQHPTAQIPSCIAQDSTFQALCTGLSVMVHAMHDVELALSAAAGANPSGGLESSHQALVAHQGFMPHRQAFVDDIRTEDTAQRQQHDARSNDLQNAMMIAKVKIQNVSCTDSLIQLTKSFWLRYLDVLAQDTSVLNSQDRSFLSGIASRCSRDFGPIVDIARAVLFAHGDTQDYEAIESCDGVQGPRSIQNSIASPVSWHLSPNPTLGESWVSFGVEQSGVVELWDTQGRLVYRRVLDQERSCRLELSEPGLYYVRYIDEQGRASAQKLSVVR